MNKKKIILIIALVFCIILAVWGMNRMSANKEDTSQSNVVSGEDTAGQSDEDKDSDSNSEENAKTDSEEEDAQEEDVQLMKIETRYGTLSYPAEWKDSLMTQESEENEIVTVTFDANVEEQSFNLFKVMICADEGDSVGTLTDSEGTSRNVFVELSELTNLDGLSEDAQNQLYSMQEGVNILISNLDEE